jgi:adenylosuccinate lyase
MENIALWHERDISHSSTERVIMPDACLALDYMLSIFTNIIDGLLVYPDAMEKNLNRTKGLVYSQRVMLALIDKGLSRQEAYKMVQRNAMKSWEKSKDFLKLLKADKEVIEKISPEELDSIFDYKYYLRFVDEIFKRLGLTESQCKKKYMALEPKQLGPRAL